MSKKLLPFLFIALLIGSCQKENVYDQNPSLIQKRELDYKDLFTENPVIVAGGEALINAVATGDSLSFLWTASGGEITFEDTLGTFTSPDEGEYIITCSITDKYGNSGSKEVTIRVTPELVFSGLSSEEYVIPADYKVTITATASGEDLSFEWHSQEGTIEGTSNKITFYSSKPGTYTISCTVTDLLGHSQSLDVEIEVVEGFVYKDLLADPQRLPANDQSRLWALAIGSNLKYSWRSDPPANLLGSGEQIIFTICHADIFTVYCEITDEKGNTQTKSVVITVTE